MHHVPELGVEDVGASINVVLEELSEGCPEIGGGGNMTEDKIENIGGDAHVNPLDDGEIILDPLWIV